MDENEVKTDVQTVTEGETTETPVEIVEEAPEEQKPKKDSVLDDLKKERKKRQELESKVKEYESKLYEESYRLTKAEAKQQYLNDGFTEEVAERFAERDAKQDREIKELKSYISTVANPLDKEIRELAESDEYFSDAVTFKDAITAKMKQYNCKADEAYMMVRGKERTHEIRQNAEVRAQYEQQEVQSKAVPAAASGKSKELYPLDEEDKKVLKTLQRLDPAGNWTAEKYYKNKNR